MSQRAICYDNAVAESFFNSLKNELPDHRSFKPLMKQRRRSLTILSSIIESADIRRWIIFSPVYYERSMAVASLSVHEFGATTYFLCKVAGARVKSRLCRECQ